jgi:hypothetical protein
MKSYYKEYSFDEWASLSEDIRRDIINNFWTPFDPNIGKETRSLILEELKKRIDSNYFFCEFGYFSHYIIGIKYIPVDTTKKVPKDFFGILINKGNIVDRIGQDEIKVRWRYSGMDIIKVINSNI